MKSTYLVTFIAFYCITTAIFAKEASEFAPRQGYTHEQELKLFPKFDKKTWNMDGDYDFSRFAYLNTSQFFPLAVIHRAGQVAELESALNPEIGKTIAKTAAGEMTLDQWTSDHLDGILVIHKGIIVYEKYPRMRPHDKHIWWSVSKSLAGTIVGLLEEQGLVDVTKPVETYIEEFKGTDWAGTPVIDILDMASGSEGLEADDPEAYTNPESPYGLFESSLGMQPTTPKTMFSTYEYIPTLKRQKASGKKYEYHSINTFVCAWIAERVTGKPYAQLVSEMIWQKMGAESDGQIIVSPAGAAASHGAISSTLRDLGRYGMLFTPSWNRVAKEKVIPDALITRIQTTGRPEIFQAGITAPKIESYMGEKVAFETRQWDFVLHDGDFGKYGYHGQTLYVSPSKDLVVVNFATGQGYDTSSFSRAIAKSLD
jgi:CubicO group peptidase (beta-lactamase class C family)